MIRFLRILYTSQMNGIALLAVTMQDLNDLKISVGKKMSILRAVRQLNERR